MRVLHLTTEFPPVIWGGLGTAVGGLAAASADAGLEVMVLLVGGTGFQGYDRIVAATATEVDCRVRPQCDRNTITVVPIGDADAVQTAVQLVRDWQPHVVHLHVFWLWHIAHAIREQTQTPLVYTVHSLDRAEYELGDGPPVCLAQWDTQEAVITAADRIVALTHSERQLIGAYCPTARDRVRVVGNGIADDRSALPYRRHTPRSDSCLVLFTGRFVERKGIRDLLCAIPRVLDRAPATRFVLAGGHRHCTGADMENYWLPEHMRPFRDRIHFTGWLTPDQLARWYRAADILVVPSWYEPFGMVILEGMLHGLAIAASAVGGPAEILEHDRTAHLFQAKCAAALANAISRLALDPVLRRRIGTAAADEVRRRWLWPEIVARMGRVYREAAEAHQLSLVG